MAEIKKILIANRGEIACRIIRTAQHMGIATVAVYSEADRLGLHVRMADEAFELGGAKAAESYLHIDKIIRIANICQADAIHPGYGFLSENALFAARVREAGLIFIGPSAEAIEMLGDKVRAKALAVAAGAPVVPGSEGAVEATEDALEVAGRIGYPVMLKASAGGGGKGMRLAHTPQELQEAFGRARSEAENAFGDGRVFIEKYIQSPRHIEVQVFGDHHGNYVHLYERECSIQRRHQKVIEEAPSVSAVEIRQQLGEAAVAIARKSGYTNAGTVEFMLDEQKKFYFLEMNTRLQVEHPVTELITGLDLVRLQIEIASGKPLPIAQQDVHISGHALELRIYAEDPENGFLPDPGRLELYAPPKGPGVRIDDGYEQGMEIPIEYDPLIGKLIGYGSSRLEAIERLQRAIVEFDIAGVKNTLSFGHFVLSHALFRNGDFDTNFVQNHYEPSTQENDENAALVAAVLAAELKATRGGRAQGRTTNPKVAERNQWKKRRYQ
jgi:acetyl-CoA carboxylase biotin carboxylase subunit